MRARKNGKGGPRRWSEDNTLLKTQPWRIKAVFDPLLSIIEQLERDGTKDVTNDGTAIFKDAVDGHWYESYTAIIGVVEAYEIHEKRAGITIDLEPLRRLAKKLEYDMMIFPSDTQDCRACFARMHSASLSMTVGYARELIKDAQIQEKMAEVGKAQQS